MTFITRSAAVRPSSTADRAIGSERKRSTTPALRSSVMPRPVMRAPKIAVWTMMPGHQEVDVVDPPVSIAPPKT